MATLQWIIHEPSRYCTVWMLYRGNAGAPAGPDFKTKHFRDSNILKSALLEDPFEHIHALFTEFAKLDLQAFVILAPFNFGPQSVSQC